MGIGYKMLGFVDEDTATDKWVAELYSRIIKKFALKEVVYDGRDIERPIRTLPEILKNELHLSKANALKRSEELFARDSSLTVEGEIIPNEEYGLHISVSSNSPYAECGVPKGFLEIYASYQLNSLPTPKNVDWWWDMLCTITEKPGVSAMNSGWGKGDNQLHFRKAIQKRKFGGVETLDVLGHLGAFNNIMFFGTSLFTKDCLDNLENLDVMRTKRLESGLLMQLVPICEKREIKLYPPTTIGINEHYSNIKHEIVELTRNRFK